MRHSYDDILLREAVSVCLKIKIVGLILVCGSGGIGSDSQLQGQLFDARRHRLAIVLNTSHSKLIDRCGVQAVRSGSGCTTYIRRRLTSLIRLTWYLEWW